MDGDAGVESTVGKGSSFWFSIKVRQTADAVKRQPVLGDSLRKIAGDQLTARVLVAEDSPINRLVAKTALGKIGLTATFVEDGLQAVEAVRSVEQFDDILMDLRMPNMDGFEATICIREFERDHDLSHHPILLLLPTPSTRIDGIVLSLA